MTRFFITDLGEATEDYLKCITIFQNPKQIKTAEELREILTQVSGVFKETPSGAVEAAIDVITKVSNGEIIDVWPRILSSFNSLGIGYALHSRLNDLGYYGRVTAETARDLARNIGPDGVVLDPMAGKGYFAKALREQGVRTIATDDYSWGKQQSKEFEKLDAIASLKKYGTETTHLLISWAPYDSKIDLELLRAVRKDFPHITIINVGENRGGCTGSEEFWDEAEEFSPKYRVRYFNVPGIRDSVVFCK